MTVDTTVLTGLPRTAPRVGPLKLLRRMLDLRYNRLDLLVSVSRVHGELAVFTVGPACIAVVASPELAAQVLVEHAEAFEKPAIVRSILGAGLGNGFLVSDNDTNRRMRKLVAPEFRHERLYDYASVVSSCTEQFQQLWAEGQIIDVAEQMRHLTLWIVGKLLFSTDVLEDAPELGHALTLGLRYVNSKLSAPLPIPLSWPTMGNLRFRSALRRLDVVVTRIIEERRLAGTAHRDVLSLLLRAARADDASWLTEAQVRDEVINLLLAGHETTASALAWTWHLLATNPVQYERVRHEVSMHLQGRTPTYADLAMLPYTLQVFKESLRLYPPAYVIGRQAVADVEVGGHRLPADTIVLISAYAMHRTPKYFPDPERFDPERFAGDAEAALPRFAFMPFGGGPRVCLGPHLALMEAHLILAALVQRVQFHLVAHQHVIPEPLISLRPKYGIKMTVRRSGLS